MSVRALRKFYEEQIEDAKKNDVLLSLHLKATMMKVSDPVMFGHAVTVFFKDVFDEARGRARAGRRQPEPRPRRPLQEDPGAAGGQEGGDRGRHQGRLREAPGARDGRLGQGHHQPHVPNDIIVDASMPVVVRESGQMWGPDGKLHDTKAMIPDRCYATMYRRSSRTARKHGALNPATMGTVPNVGLMAQQAEEYGSHDKTFIAPGAGTIRVVDDERARRCSSRRSRRATSSGCARRRTRRSATGSSSRSPGRAPPARRPSSGSTRPARTTRRSSRRSRGT